MSAAPLESEPCRQKLLEEVAGYLNFSSGAPDAKFLRNLNELFRRCELAVAPDGDAVATLCQWFLATLGRLCETNPAFVDTDQARCIVQLLEAFRASYREFHRDLLWHRQDEELWRPLFIGRSIEALLAQGPPWNEPERIVPAARDQFDNYLGYRPVAVVESQQDIQPYRHEWVRPIPLYVAGAGVGAGPYEELIARTLTVLRETDATLLRESWFNPELLEELALDPRAYDFDHPVNKRPNYHFGQWDPHRIDNSGYYRRFVLQPLALEALLSRVEQAGAVGAAREDLLFEAAAVLAGTMLMASGTSGNGPGCHGSDVSLSTLLPHIAKYRDRFYEDLLKRASGPQGERLRSESQRMRQPFGGARQHLNQELARRRATQLQHVHLAQIYARMGFPEAALKQARTVRVASARMLCHIYCRMTAGHHAIDNHQLELVTKCLPEIEDLLNRGIECGAMVDPWNIIGFGGNFSLFPALENTVHDYRVDDLIMLVEQVLDLCSRAWTEAAAIDDADLENTFSTTLARLSDWWDKYATASVGGLKRLVAKDVEVSTNLVAGALNAWHKAGAAAGDVRFWRMFVDQFDSPKAFQLVIEALLDKDDFVSSMALMMQWVSQSELTPLEDGDAAFHPLALRWLRMVEARQLVAGTNEWPLVAKFFTHLQASAEEYWQVPQFELSAMTEEEQSEHDEQMQKLFGDESLDDDGDHELDNLFSAAYEDVVYRDSTDDGMDSAIFDSGAGETEYELEQESERLNDRLAFLTTLARLWKHAAVAWEAPQQAAERRDQLEEWQQEATSRYVQLVQLLETVHRHRIPAPRSTHESMVEYDRRRTMKDSLLERIIALCVDMSDAARLLRAAAGAHIRPAEESAEASPIAHTMEILRAILAGDVEGVRRHWPDFLRSLSRQELLYVPLARGGSPRRIVKARALHHLVHDLLGWLPRLGLVRETCQLLDTSQAMEADHPVGAGAVTEYDRLFETGYQALVRCLVASADAWDEGPHAECDIRPSDSLLVEALQDLTETQLHRWLRHSRTVRLSVVEKLAGESEWQRFVQFTERYGSDLFTQKFLSLGNLRAILHQGVGVWLSNLEQNDDGDEELPLIEDLGRRIARNEAVELLTIAIEAVVENYREYRDYNATTTQSDRGELLYTFVDFVRLRTAYDRVAWNLKPVFLAHEILIRQDRAAAAELWQRAVADRTAEQADLHQQAFADLCEAYGMRLPTVAERLAERFTRPLAIDRVRALVAPAISAADSDGDCTAFMALEMEIEGLLQEPTGAGLDVPDWIAALEDEVTTLRHERRHHQPGDGLLQRIAQVRLNWDELQQQLADDCAQDS
ncbi:MAG: hypothetical protein WD851_25000 [Pirellulales bacterium]